MKIKVSNTTNIQLDWLAAKCEGLEVLILIDPIEVSLTTVQDHLKYGGWVFKPSTNWLQGGQIIDRADIDTFNTATDLGFKAVLVLNHDFPEVYFQQYGPTKLIAAMRCYVASKLGEEVEVPEELGEQSCT